MAGGSMWPGSERRSQSGSMTGEWSPGRPALQIRLRGQERAQREGSRRIGSP